MRIPVGLADNRIDLATLRPRSRNAVSAEFVSAMYQHHVLILGVEFVQHAVGSVNVLYSLVPEKAISVPLGKCFSVRACLAARKYPLPR